MCEGGYGEGVRNVFGIGEKQIIRVFNNGVQYEVPILSVDTKTLSQNAYNKYITLFLKLE